MRLVKISTHVGKTRDKRFHATYCEHVHRMPLVVRRSRQGRSAAKPSGREISGRRGRAPRILANGLVKFRIQVHEGPPQRSDASTPTCLKGANALIGFDWALGGSRDGLLRWCTARSRRDRSCSPRAAGALASRTSSCSCYVISSRSCAWLVAVTTQRGRRSSTFDRLRASVTAGRPSRSIGYAGGHGSAGGRRGGRRRRGVWWRCEPTRLIADLVHAPATSQPGSGSCPPRRRSAPR
jgi:hypothetical protein